MVTAHGTEETSVGCGSGRIGKLGQGKHMG